MNNTKTCNKCLIEKSISDFSKNTQKKDGVCGSCKSCTNIVKQAYVLRNPERVKQSKRAWAENNKNKIDEKNRRYRVFCKDAIKAIGKKYRDTHKETVLKTKKRYYDKHPEEITERRKFWYFVSPEILKRDNYTCCLCNSVGGKLHVHHIIPWSSDIENRFNKHNIITLCKLCHSLAHNSGKYKTINEAIKVQLQTKIKERYFINTEILKETK